MKPSGEMILPVGVPRSPFIIQPAGSKVLLSTQDPSASTLALFLILSASCLAFLFASIASSSIPREVIQLELCVSEPPGSTQLGAKDN